MEATLSRIEEIRRSNPENLAAKHFDRLRFTALPEQLQMRWLACIQSGLTIPESEMGAYAQAVEDYEDLHDLFDPLIEAHHGLKLEAITAVEAQTKEPSKRPSNERDLSQIGLAPISCRVRLARNVDGFAFTTKMNLGERKELEGKIADALKAAAEKGIIAGNYHSLTPGHQNECRPNDLVRLLKLRLIFPDLRQDRYLMAAGIADDWPSGRGCFLSYDEQSGVWIGEEDHLRIFAKCETTDLNAAYRQVKKIESTIQSGGIGFAHDERLGFLTSCPTNIGTGMRASVHLPLPNAIVTRRFAQLKERAKRLGLAIRGLAGEHTAPGSDGTVDISPSVRLGVSEEDILARLFDGIAALNDWVNLQ